MPAKRVSTAGASPGKPSSMPAKRVSTAGASPGWVMIQNSPLRTAASDADSHLCGRETGRPCEALADHEAHRLRHLGPVLETQRGRPAAFGLHHLGVDRAGAEDTHANGCLVDCQLLSQGLGDGDHCHLGGTVWPDEGDAAEKSRYRSGIDNVRRSALVAHDRHKGVHPVHNAPEVDAHHPPPVVEGLVADQIERGDAGVVAQHVDAPEPFQRRRCEQVDGSGIRHIHLDGESDATPGLNTLRDRFRLAVVEVGDDDG